MESIKSHETFPGLAVIPTYRKNAIVLRQTFLKLVNQEVATPFQVQILQRQSVTLRLVCFDVEVGLQPFFNSTA